MSLVNSEGLEYLVSRREKTFDYLKRAHQSKCHWMNVVKLSKLNIIKFIPKEKRIKRTRRWFILGLSLGGLLEFSGISLIRNLVQLLEEYENYLSTSKNFSNSNVNALLHTIDNPSNFIINNNNNSNNTNLSLARLGASQTNNSNNFPIDSPWSISLQQGLINNSIFNKENLNFNQNQNWINSNGEKKPGSSGSNDFTEFKPNNIQKIGKQLIYEFLQTPFVSIADCDGCDYIEIVHSLLDNLSLIYNKFLDPAYNHPAVTEAVVKIDRKIKNLVISKICSDLNLVAAPLVKLELKGLLNHLFIDEARSNPITKKYIQLEGDKVSNNLGLNDIMVSDDEDDDD